MYVVGVLVAEGYCCCSCCFCHYICFAMKLIFVLFHLLVVLMSLLLFPSCSSTLPMLSHSYSKQKNSSRYYSFSDHFLCVYFREFPVFDLSLNLFIAPDCNFFGFWLIDLACSSCGFWFCESMSPILFLKVVQQVSVQCCPSMHTPSKPPNVPKTWFGSQTIVLFPINHYKWL